MPALDFCCASACRPDGTGSPDSCGILHSDPPQATGLSMNLSTALRPIRWCGGGLATYGRDGMAGEGPKYDKP